MDEIAAAVLDIAASPWIYPALFLLVVADAFLVVLPSETVVVALGAVAASSGEPSVVLLVPVMQAAAWLASQGNAPLIRIFAALHVMLTMATFLFARFLDDFWWVAPMTLLLCMTAWYVTRGGGCRSGRANSGIVRA